MSEHREIPLSQGKVAIVDAADFDWLSQWKWSAMKVGRKGAPPKFYAVRVTKKGKTDGKPKMILMHRLISGAEEGKVADHRDLDTLNNCRLNLRVCTQAGNSLNQKGHRDRGGSRFKGVWWHRKNLKWCADFRGRYLGSFDTEELAAAAYDKAAYAHAPDMALLNCDIGVQ